IALSRSSAASFAIRVSRFVFAPSRLRASAPPRLRDPARPVFEGHDLLRDTARPASRRRFLPAVPARRGRGARRDRFEGCASSLFAPPKWPRGCSRSPGARRETRAALPCEPWRADRDSRTMPGQGHEDDFVFVTLLEHRSGTGRARKRLRGQRIALTGAFGRLPEQPRPATGGGQPPVHEPFAVLHGRLRLLEQAREGKSVFATLLEQPREDDFLPAALP